ncbi:hypothetical protein GOP47_0008145 [Adiantum capillus-veneris]|uniref:Uncharacterized protein n=1 Tax=Adiantum capillus-veneris TaxID=13818 RepID=A0A9D4UXP6_ADICA|nr:hypothetical protein GOP47_0008145 [Adiantum capillus-veneris]
MVYANFITKDLGPASDATSTCALTGCKKVTLSISDAKASMPSLETQPPVGLRALQSQCKTLDVLSSSFPLSNPEIGMSQSNEIQFVISHCSSQQTSFKAFCGAIAEEI